MNIICIAALLCLLSVSATAQSRDRAAIDSIVSGVYRGWTVEALGDQLDSNATAYFDGNIGTNLRTLLMVRNHMRRGSLIVERVEESETVIFGDMAYVRSMTCEDRVGKEQRCSKYTFVLRKSRSTWRILHMHTSFFFPMTGTGPSASSKVRQQPVDPIPDLPAR